MNNFTLIIPTHNRHEYLRRSISYFKNLKAQVIYCDSSPNPYNKITSSNILYLHLPNYSFAEKILHALNLIKTDFVALCADDDFILIESLYQAEYILSTESSIKTIIGENIFFCKNHNGNFYHLNSFIPQEINHSPIANASNFFSNYEQILWGIYDKKILVKSFEIIKKAKYSNDNFIELTIGAIVCFSGGIKFLDNIWSIRELSNDDHWGTRHKNIKYIHEDKNIKRDFKTYKTLVDELTIKGYSDLILKKYLNLNRSKKYFLIIKSLIKKVLRKNISIVKINDKKPIIQVENYALNKYKIKEFESIVIENLLITNE